VTLGSVGAPFGLIGHEDVLRDLRGFRGHAVLLVGPARVGKRLLARTWAAMLNCSGPDRSGLAAPCGVCPSCVAVLRETHPDLLEVEPKATTSTGKTARRRLIPVSVVTARRDDGREYERHVVEWLETSATHRRKVVVIDGAEFLGEESANALLKVVEEPPHRAVFVFLTEDAHAVLPTIASRAARMRVPPVSDALVRDVLQRLGETDADLLVFAAGRPGVIVERERARAALTDAREFVSALDTGMLSALEGAEALEKRFDPQWHPEALRFVLRDRGPDARSRADDALEAALAALERYVSPSLVFQVLALDLRAALRTS